MAKILPFRFRRDRTAELRDCVVGVDITFDDEEIVDEEWENYTPPAQVLTFKSKHEEQRFREEREEERRWSRSDPDPY